MRPIEASVPRLALLSLAAALASTACTPKAQVEPSQPIRRALQGTIPAAGGTITGTTSGNSEFTAGCQYDSQQAPEHVYAWTPEDSGVATFSTCGAGTSFDTVLYVSTASDGTAQFECNDQTYACDTASGESKGSRFSFFAIAGTTYYLYIDGNQDGQQGNYTLTVVPPTFQGVIPPGGGTFSGALSGASTSRSSTCGGENYPEHVYEWTPAVSGPANFSTCGAATHFDTVVYLRKASDGQEVDCQDDLLNTGCLVAGGVEGGTNLTLEGDKEVIAGVKYLVYVDASWDVGDGAYRLTVAPSCTTAAQCSDEDPCTTDSCSSGFCQHGPVDATCAANQRATVKVTPMGWGGVMCVDGLCGSGSRTLELGRGPHNFGNPYDVDDSGSYALGTLTVNPNGTVTPNSALRRYFIPGTTAQGNPELVAQTEAVNFNFNGYEGMFTIAGYGDTNLRAVSPPAVSDVVLLKGRNYTLMALYAADVEAVPPVSTAYGFKLGLDGVLRLDPAVGHYFQQSGASGRDLTVRVASVAIDPQGYPGTFVIGGVGYPAPNTPTKLMIDRKYQFGPQYAAPDPQIGDGYTLQVLQGAAPTPSIQMMGNGAVSFEAEGTNLKARVSPVFIQRNGYTGTLGVNGVGYFPDLPRLNLIVGRQYGMLGGTTFTVPTSGACSPTQMNLGGTTVGILCGSNLPPVCGDHVREGTEECDGPDASACTVGCGSTCSCINGTGITLDARGYTAGLCISNVGCAYDQVKPFTLPPNTYYLVAPNTVGGDGLSTVARVTVNAGGSLTDPDNGPLLTYFDVSGATLKPKTSEVTLVANGYNGIFTVGSGYFIYAAQNKTRLMHGRKYNLQAYYSMRDGMAGANLSSAPYGLIVDVNGDLTVDDDTGISIAASGKTLTPKVAQVTVNMNSYPGIFAVGNLGFITASSASMKLLNGRKYYLQAYYTEGEDTVGAYLSSAPYGLTVNDTGTAVSTDAQTSLTLRATGTDLTLTAQTVPVRFAFNGYGGLLVPSGGLRYLHQGDDTVHLLKNRKYSMEAWYSNGIEFDGAPMSRAPYGFSLDADGAITMDADTLRSLEPSATGPSVKISNVRIDPNGYQGQLCVGNVGCVQGTPQTFALMTGRRYTLSGAGTLSVIDASTCSTTPAQLTVEGHDIQIQCTGTGNGIIAVNVLRQKGGLTGVVTEPVPNASVKIYQGSTVVGTTQTDGSGVAVAMLPGDGPYRFQTDFWGAQFYSSPTADCTPTSCLNKTILVSGVVVTVLKPGPLPYEGLFVNAMTGGPPWTTAAATWVARGTTDSEGEAHIGLPSGTLYRFYAADSQGEYWSSQDCPVPDCATATIEAGAEVKAQPGPDRGAGSGASVTLFGSHEPSTPGETVAYSWTQESGPTVPLGGATTRDLTFVAPSVTTLTELVFSLAVNRNGAASAPANVSVLVLPEPNGGDITPLGKVIARVEDPTERPNSNRGVIRDGDLPPVGSTDWSRQYDTARGDYSATEDWIGYDYSTTTTFRGLVFQEGGHWTNGGWFENLSVQVRQGASWITIPSPTVSPAYPGNTHGATFETYRATFAPIAGNALRIHGLPGGSDRFISASELRVYGAPTWSDAIQLVAEHSGKCVNATLGGTASQQDCSVEAIGQQFHLRTVRDGHQLFTEDGSKCLGAQGGAFNTPGTDLAIVDCTSPGTTWKLSPDQANHRLVAAPGSLCADVDMGSTLSGTRVLMWNCADLPQQRWTLRYLAQNECDGVPDGEQRVCGGSNICNPKVCKGNVCQGIPVADPAPCIQTLASCAIDMGSQSPPDIVYVYENWVQGQNVQLPIGPTNTFNELSPGIGRDRGQARVFPPGRGAFRTALRSAADTWTLGLGAVTATSNTASCVIQRRFNVEEVVINGSPYPVGIDEVGVLAASQVDTWTGSDGTPGDHATGKTPGSFGVDHNGGATYSIPIPLPREQAGFTPRSLAINYSSQAGNGILGVGFYLGGTSRIERCTRDGNFLDEESGPVEWNEPAAGGQPYGLCLDGQKLVPVQATAPVTTYRLFDDPSVTVRVRESDADGPRSFELFDGSGNVSFYGSTPDSRLGGQLVDYEKVVEESPLSLCVNDPVCMANKRRPYKPVSGAQRTFAWALSGMRGRFGAFADYKYERQQHPDLVGRPGIEFPQVSIPIEEQRLIEISYGDSLVKFGYEDREDKTDRYVRGLHLATTKRLNSIEVKTKVNSVIETVRRYELKYEASLAPLTRRSRLEHVKECDGKGKCRKPSVFDWQEESIDFVRPEGIGLSLNGIDGEWAKVVAMFVADLNDDGRDDILLRTGTKDQPGWQFALSNGSGFDPLKAASLPPGKYSTTETWTLIVPTPSSWTSELPLFSKTKFHLYNQMAITDLNADGKPEVGIWEETAGKGAYKFFNINSSSGTATPSSLSIPAHVMPYIADLNNDGLPELITKDSINTKWRVNVNNPGNPGSFVGYYEISGDRVRDIANSQFQDTDGDGRLELLAGVMDNNQFYGAFTAPAANKPLVYPGFSQTWLQPELAQSPVTTRIINVDLNGDGFPESLRVWVANHSCTSLPLDNYQTFFFNQNTGNGLAGRASPPAGPRAECPVQPFFESSGVGGIGLPPSLVTYWVCPDDTPTCQRSFFVDSGVRPVDLDGDGQQELLVTGLPKRCVLGRANGTNTITPSWGILADGTIGPHCRDEVQDQDLGKPYVVRRAWDGTWSKDLVQGVDFAPGVTFAPSDPDNVEYFGAKLNTTLDIDGDGIPEIVQPRASAPWAVHLQIYRRRAAKKADLLIGVTDGLGARTSIEYGPLSDRSLHTPAEQNCSYPLKCLKRGRWLVSKVTRDTGVLENGTEPKQEELHTYVGARMDQLQKSWLGFEEHRVEDKARGLKTTYFFRNTVKEGKVYPFAGMVEREVRDYTLDQTLLRIESKTNYLDLANDSQHSLVRPLSSCTSKYEVPKPVNPPQPGGWVGGPPIQWGDPFSKVCQTFSDHDEWGFPRSTGATGGAESRTSTIVYKHIDQLNGSLPLRVLGSPTRVVESSTVSEVASPPRTTEYIVDDKGMVEQEIVEPNGSSMLYRQTIYERDPYGQPTSVTVLGSASAPDPITGQKRGGGAPSRTTHYEYDGHGNRRVVVNPAGHREQFVYDPRHGGVVAHRSAGGLVTRQTYDGFGRPVETIPPTEAHTYVSYTFGLGGTRIETKREAPGAALLDRQASHHDKLGRPVLTERTAPQGKTQFTWTNYDRFGRVASVNAPTFTYLSPEAKRQVTTYDALDRITQINDADGQLRVKVEYEKLKSTAWNGLGKRHVVIRDATGLMLNSQSQDNQGTVKGQVTFTYGFFNQLERMTKNLNGTSVESVFTYDDLGRRTTSSDPDRGQTTFVPNAFGEVVHQRFGTGPVETRFYDELGRQVRIEDPDGVTQFDYDRAPGGIGQLNWSRSPDGIESTRTFDPPGRPTGEFVEVPEAAGPGLSATFATESWYDTSGRLGGLMYPSTGSRRFEVVYEYSASAGAVVLGVRDGEDKKLWQAEDFSPFGELAQERFANGFRTRWGLAAETGRLDNVKGGFTPDPFASEFDLNVPGLPSTLVQDVTYSYDTARNVDGRVDRGRGVGGWGEDLMVNEQYGYDDLNRLSDWTVVSWDGSDSSNTKYTYGFDDYGNLKGRTTPSQAYEWSFTYGSSRPHAITSANVAGDIRNYSYDARGRRREDFGRTVTYTWFDLPKRIDAGPTTIARFEYDAARTRVRKVAQGTETITVGLYERIAGEFSPQGAKHIFRVQGPGRVVAEVEWDAIGSPLAERYLHPARLGTIEVVTGPAHEITRQRYEPYGNAVSPLNPIQPVFPSVGGGTRRGFTGHEHDDELGYINMNGRIYDPISASFLTTDPVLTYPGYAHAFHPYSYVVNNPVNMVDPTGFQPATAPDGGANPDAGPPQTSPDWIWVPVTADDGSPWEMEVEVEVTTDSSGSKTYKVKAPTGKVRPHKWKALNGANCVANTCHFPFGPQGRPFQYSIQQDERARANFSAGVEKIWSMLGGPTDFKSFAAFALLPIFSKMIASGLRGGAGLMFEVAGGADLAVVNAEATDRVVSLSAKALANARNENIVSISGLAGVKAGEKLAIVAHGSESTLGGMTSQQLSSIINASGIRPAYIELVACKTGAKSFASEVASQTGAVVRAPVRNVNVMQDVVGVPQVRGLDGNLAAPGVGFRVFLPVVK
jgi:RHS repeat-associated protein